MDTAVEANLGAAGHGPRTELSDEDYYPQGSWDTVFLVALLLLGLPANGLMAWLAGSQARHGAGTRLALLLLSLALSDFLFLAAATFNDAFNYFHGITLVQLCPGALGGTWHT